jgi:hypothetical protein
LFFNGATIKLLARRHDYFPASFRWRGRRFGVLAVERCWTKRKPLHRRFFRVRCQVGIFVLEQMVDGDKWRVLRWPWRVWLPLLRPTMVPRFPLPRGQRRPADERGVRGWLMDRLLPPAGLAIRRPSWSPTTQRS